MSSSTLFLQSLHPNVGIFKNIRIFNVASQTVTEVTMSTMPPAATKKALGINELLENVLFYLPMKDLIHAQKVCQQWRNVVQKSKALRQHLYLEPQPVTTHPEACSCPDKATWTTVNSFMPMGKHAIDRLPHPFLQDLYEPRSHGEDYSSLWFEREDIVRILSWPSGTWEDMLVLQPPPKRVLLRTPSLTKDIAFIGIIEMIEEPTGVRLGQIVRAMRAQFSNSGRVWCGMPDHGDEVRANSHLKRLGRSEVLDNETQRKR